MLETVYEYDISCFGSNGAFDLILTTIVIIQAKKRDAFFLLYPKLFHDELYKQ